MAGITEGRETENEKSAEMGADAEGKKRRRYVVMRMAAFSSPTPVMKKKKKSVLMPPLSSWSDFRGKGTFTARQ